MPWGERVFVGVCSLVVLAMIGPLSLAVGTVCAAIIGALMWAMLSAIPGPERRRR